VSRILRDTLQRFLNREWTRRNANGEKSYLLFVIRYWGKTKNPLPLRQGPFSERSVRMIRHFFQGGHGRPARVFFKEPWASCPPLHVAETSCPSPSLEHPASSSEPPKMPPPPSNPEQLTNNSSPLRGMDVPVHVPSGPNTPQRDEGVPSPQSVTYPSSPITNLQFLSLPLALLCDLCGFAVNAS
jgi:hypothetical protein